MRPYHVLLFIAAVMACLAALCIVLPGRVMVGDTEVRWPTLAEVMGETADVSYQDSAVSCQDSDTLDYPVDTVIPEIRDTVTPVYRDTVIQKRPSIQKMAVDSTIDSRVYLSAFYASLQESDKQTVRVIHYGDSQIEEDRMTQQIREALQKRFGGAGVGLMPLVQTIPTRTVAQRLHMNGHQITPAQGPTRQLVYGPKRSQREDGLYGVMGQVALMNDSLVRGSEQLMTVCKPLTAGPRYTRWRVFADTTIHTTFSGDTVWLEGRGKVYGMSQESHKGVIVDNIPMRGALGLTFTKMDRGQLKSFYHNERVRLIILQYGGNAIPFNKNPGTIQGIVNGLRQQIHYLRALAPEASILFIGPSDMIQLTDGQWESYPMVSYMDKLLRKMASEEQIAYFSLYRWMGGAGSMLRWQELGLAGTDGVHFSRSGARKAGNAVAEWMLEGMNE